MDGFLLFYQIGITAVYIIFVAKNIQKIVEHETDFRVDTRVHMLFYIVPYLLMISVRNLKILAPFSTLANLFQFIGKRKC